MVWRFKGFGYEEFRVLSIMDSTFSGSKVMAWHVPQYGSFGSRRL